MRSHCGPAARWWGQGTAKEAAGGCGAHRARAQAWDPAGRTRPAPPRALGRGRGPAGTWIQAAHTAPMRASRSASSAVTVEGRARPTAAITARSRFIAGLASDPPCRHVPALSGRAPAGRTGREAGEGRGWGRARLPEREDFQATVGAGVVCIHRNLP